ncbi:MAG: TetR/AcrR family transcriptional regulator [Lachnospiraceae bacterium]|nr:TetR/AcrR family transcriptional regulator [Lachnospiraceae bacterium]
MPKDKTESHNRIIPAAKQEFLEKGFRNASTRAIAAKAGITSGGLYRHFKDKEAMFAALVDPAVAEFNEWMDAHIRRGYGGALSGDYDAMWKDNEVDMIRKVVYPNLDAFRLILCCSQGTKYENFVNDLVMEHQRIMLDVFEKLRAKGVPVRDVSEEELHILMSAYTTAMFEPVVHNYPLEKAMHHLKTVEAFFLPGWHDLMGC